MENITSQIFKSFSKVYPLTLKDFDTLLQNCKVKSYKKGEQILSLGQIENRMTFILTGIVHRTVKIDNKILR